MSSHRLFFAVVLSLVLVTGFVVYRDLTQVRNEHARTKTFSSGNVPLDAIPEDPSPFLEDQLLTGAPEHALLLEGDTAEPVFDLLAAEEPAVDVLSGEAPPELPNVDEVDPVPLLTPDRREANIAAIRNALPEVSDERLEFWLEETRDLPPEMIRDMLMLRKHFGSLTESFSSDQIPQSPEAEKPRVVVSDPDQTDPALQMLQEARALVQQNMMNDQSIGYLATQLVFVEDRGTFHGGVRLAESSLSLKPGNHLKSDRPLDISFEWNRTFLVVHDGVQQKLTRYGRLMVGPSRQLKLSIEGTNLIVAPQILIPEGVTNVVISEEGIVAIPDEESELEGENWKSLGQLELKTVTEPAYLKPVGSACYVPTKRSGAMIDLPSTIRKEYLFPRTLQQSNVDSQHESWMLERIDGWLKLRNSQELHSPTLPVKVDGPKLRNGIILDVF